MERIKINYGFLFQAWQSYSKQHPKILDNNICIIARRIQELARIDH
jgi:hypothetical protein